MAFIWKQKITVITNNIEIIISYDNNYAQYMEDVVLPSCVTMGKFFLCAFIALSAK
jgi:hypothetical protein